MREYIANLLTEQGIKTEDVKAILTTIDEKVVYYANTIRTNLNGLEENIAASLEGYNVILEMAVSKLTELFVVMQDYTTSGNFDFTESDAVSYIGKSDGTSNIEIPNQNETTNTEAPEFADRAMEYMNMDGTINPEGTLASDEGKSFSDLAMDHLNDDATANYQGIDSNAYVDAVSGAAANIDVNSAPNASASGNDNSNSGNMASVNGPFVNREVIS